MNFLNLPNTLTLSRLILSPLILPFLLTYLLPFNIIMLNYAVAFLFLAFAFTDYFDGYFARKYGLESKLGSQLDPIADKFLIYSTLIGLLAAHKIYFYWVVILIGREFFVMGLRLIAVENKFSVPVSRLAKIKTAVTMICITYLICIPYNEIGCIKAGWVYGVEYLLLGLTIALSVYTAKQYFDRFLYHFTQ